MTSTQTRPASAGDAVEVVGHKVGESARRGKIMEILGAPDHVHYRVSWEDGRESVLYPGSDVHIARVEAERKPKPKRA
jgi:hypothetical protein